MLGFHLKKTEERERKGLNYNNLCKSFFSFTLVFFFSLKSARTRCCLLRRRVSRPADRRRAGGRKGGQATSPTSRFWFRRNRWGWGRGRAGWPSSLCVKLLGGGLLVGGAGGFPLAQVVAALVLLPHAVDQQEDEEDGKEEADDAAGDDS